MATPFQQQIQKALENPSLQGALDGNAEKRRTARSTGYASLREDPETLRARLHQMRQDVIENLDAYLEQFSQQAQAHGMIIHHAANSSQAIELALDIIRQAGGKRIVKSKTMVGEEIELNTALEKAGLQVVETDLGEWIVQLRGERPSHIITPAVHLNRGDVGRLFAEKLGMPYTEDIPVLTAAARRSLRAEFLAADVGISGVNFGIAENGMICLVTNEGNGRMVTTLPPLHIAFMGIERMIPSLKELDLILSMLPRSSTGQKMSVYTSLIQSPRRSGEIDGALQRHLVLLDNGRRALRQSPLKEALYCIRCGACLNVCPVFRELGGHAYVGAHGEITPYSGPIGSVISPGLFGVSKFGNLARASSLCGACQEACPVDIPLPELLLRVRAAEADAPLRLPESGKRRSAPPNVPLGLNWGLRGFSWLSASPWRFAAAQKLAGIAGKLVARRSGWLKIPAFTGWGVSRDFPSPARESFHERWQRRQEQNSTKETTPALARKIQAAKQPATTKVAPTTDQVGSPTANQVGSPTADQVGANLAQCFQHELELLEGRVVRCPAAELPERIANQIADLGIERICAWETAYLPDGLLSALSERGIQVVHTPDPQVRLGLTGAWAGIAESGTLLLPSGQGRPQSVSLLPEIHLAVLETGNLVANLAELDIRKLGEVSSLSLVSGPSRTADIEMTLTIGVHGPGQLIVFVID
jgi:L-lactate dehydrogenase complex protein LldF